MPPPSRTQPKGFRFRPRYAQVRGLAQAPKASGNGLEFFRPLSPGAASLLPQECGAFFFWIKDGPPATRILPRSRL